MTAPTVYLASILLEPNRWKPGRLPSIRVSEWSQRAAEAGFAGWELFENHVRKIDSAEREKLEHGSLPVAIFNTYAVFDAAGEADLVGVRDEVKRVGAKGIKFNLGNDPAQTSSYRTAIDDIRRALPDEVRLLAECHPGTLLEKPEALVEFLQGWSDSPFEVIIHPFLLSPQAIRQWGDLLGPLTTHAHVQFRSPTDSARFLQLADDTPRALACLEALAATGFRGTFSLEFAAPTGRPEETPETLFTAAVRDLEFLRAHWRG